MKIIHFSEISALEKYPELSEIKKKFSVATNSNSLSAEQILREDFDVIELASGDFKNFKSVLKSLDLKTSRLNVADCLIKIHKDFRPVQLLSECIFKVILQKVPDLKSSESAVVIGEYDFVLAMTYKLAQAGFFKIIIATEKLTESNKIKTLVLAYAFNIVIETVPLSELTQLEGGSVLLISNLSKKANPEAYESITYFNFLARGAVFVDLNSRNEANLVEEARRAEIIVIEEVQILQQKYQTILEMFKNSSLV